MATHKNLGLDGLTNKNMNTESGEDQRLGFDQIMEIKQKESTNLKRPLNVFTLIFITINTKRVLPCGIDF